MVLARVGHAIGVSLISLTLLLAAPDIGTSQVVRSGLSADRPLSYSLSNISWFHWNGIWVRSNGMWAWRPTVRPDWQAYFRCQAGHGCGGIGWRSHSFWSWAGGIYGAWDLVPGGWMWFPGHRFSNTWDLWFLGPRRGFWGSGFGPRFSPSMFFTGWSGGLTLVRTVPSYMPAQWSEDDRRTASAAGIRAPDRAIPLVDPVRLGPRVEPDASGVNVGSSPQELESESGDVRRKRYLSPKADPDGFEPKAAKTIRSWKEPGLRPASNSSADRRGSSVKPSSIPSAASRPKSTRSPATGSRATGRSNSNGKKTPAKE